MFGALGALDSLTAGGGLSASSSATSQGGNVGPFNFSPKAGINPWLLGGIAVAAVIAFAVLRRK
jgi:hypothetical protein